MILISIIINFVIGMALILFAKITFGFEVTSFSLFYVLPVGSFLAGAIMCGGFGRSLFKKNIKSTVTLKIANLLMAMVFFVIVQFAYYQVTYLDEDMYLNSKFQGEHVSNFIMENDEPVNFVNFTVDKINSQVITFTRKTRAIGSFEGNVSINWLFFLIDFIGFVLGGAMIYSVAFTDAVYCETCKKYMKDHEIFTILEGAPEKIDKLKSLIDHGSVEALETFINENPVQKSEKEAFYYKGILVFCEECADGFIRLEYQALDSKGKYEYDSDQNIKLDLSRDLVRQLSKL